MKRIRSAARIILPLAVLIALFGSYSARPALAAGVVGNGTPASCGETAFDNALVGGGNVTFNCGPNPVTITLTFYKQIGTNTTIDGGNKVTLSASNTYHFQVYSGRTLTLKNIVLANGSSTSVGSIENLGKLKATNVTFSKNKATGASGQGGAVLNSGSATFTNSRFIKNSASVGGGAIWNDSGKLKITGSSFKSNKATDSNATGGAIAVNNGKLTLASSSLVKNQATEGGAIWTSYTSTNSISGSTLNKNKGNDGAGIVNYGVTEISNSTISNNKADAQGGGIFHGGSLTLTNSTVRGNRAELGGGMRNFGQSTIISRSTFSGNSATQDGGGVFSSTPATLANSTLSGNTAGPGNGGGGWYQYHYQANFRFVTIANNSAGYGGGIYAEGSVTQNPPVINLKNSVLSNNPGFNCEGATITSNGYNVSSDIYCSSGLTQPTDHNSTAANLGPLASNGGPTQTHLPQAGSYLINHGQNDAAYPTDQRGFTRPVNGTSDIGSVEVQ